MTTFGGGVIEMIRHPFASLPTGSAGILRHLSPSSKPWSSKKRETSYVVFSRKLEKPVVFFRFSDGMIVVARILMLIEKYSKKYSELATGGQVQNCFPWQNSSSKLAT